jgi:MYXO-CTERM domain-containing protein
MVNKWRFVEEKMARQLILLAASVLFCGPAMAVPYDPAPGPSPDFDTGLIGFVMLAGAAFLARRRRRG